jgi:hypothetical protein
MLAPALRESAVNEQVLPPDAQQVHRPGDLARRTPEFELHDLSRSGSSPGPDDPA